ncbi:MAG TPA: S24/S26 family peptidase [Candidatus Scubalenecus merdavium]|uniref:S24/S26 family peptidase n=1 Tax=Candidatus Scybalenecus merdavium TaxID=2840939 RepID=A0A9D1SNF7_9FIRM|nr:S24/S26 family peptidase [Candidatus Scubalenecus merdavium]
MEQPQTIEHVLQRYGHYTGVTKGNSMWPLLHENKDNIIVLKTQGRLKKYDVPVYIAESGKYTLHRIVRVRENDYVIMGDNLLTKEYVTDSQICGRLAGFYKNGKKYVDCDTSRLYKLYSRVWVFLIPVRPCIMALHRFLSKLKRGFARGK